MQNTPWMKYISLLWPTAPLGNLSVWSGGDRYSIHAPKGTFTDTDVHSLFKKNSNGQNIYLGLASRKEGLSQAARGKKTDCLELPAIAIDIDLFDQNSPESHNAKALPTTRQDLDFILSACPLEPSFAVNTGNGFHLYWLLDTPIQVAPHTSNQIEKFHSLFAKKYDEKGWHFDSTHSVDRVWRIPGFLNNKTNPPKEVKLMVKEPAVRYSAEQLGLSSYETKNTRAPVNTSDLTALQSKLSNLKDKENKKLLSLVLEGKSFADRGSRDETMQRVASIVVFCDQAKHSATELAELFRPSLSLWANEPDAQKSTEQEMQKMQEKIARAQAEYLDKKEKEKQSDAAIDSVFAKQGHPSSKHLVIQKGSAFYAYNATSKQYEKGCSQVELMQVLRDSWKDIDVPLQRMDDNGQQKQRSISEILFEHATVAGEVIYDLGNRTTRYDEKERTLFCEAAPLTHLEPKFDADVNQWLHLLPEREEDLDPLLDWVACVSANEHQCAALYLSGAPDVGKTVFTTGLAQLWRISAASKLVHVLAKFNATLLDCPLVVLDEKWDDQKVNLCGAIRDLIGNTRMKIEPKGLAQVTLIGALRVMITCNNDNILNVEGNGEMTEDDRKATAERILHIKCSMKAKEFMDNCTAKFNWLNDKTVAKHALWLKQQRLPRILAERGTRRYLVRGKYKQDFHGNIGQTTDLSDALMEIVLRSILTPKASIANGKMARYCKDGFRINAQCILDGWDTYLVNRYKNIMPQSLSKLSRTMHAFSEPMYDSRLKKRVVKIKLDYLVEQADRLLEIGRDELVRALENKLFANGDDE